MCEESLNESLAIRKFSVVYLLPYLLQNNQIHLKFLISLGKCFP